MAKEKAGRGHQHGFAIDLDESLIADALAAVERRTDSPVQPALSQREDALEDAIVPGGAALDEGDGVAADRTEALEVEEVAFPGDADGEASAPDEASEKEALLGEEELAPAAEDEVALTREELLEMTAQLELEFERLSAENEDVTFELEQLRSEIDGARSERDESRRRAREALRKAGIMVVKSRRKDELIEQLRLDIQDSRSMIHQRDQTIRDLKGARVEEERERERLRARHRREAEEARRFANEKLLKNLLPVLDHMELALAHADAEPERIREGVDITWNQLLAVLTRAGLQRIELGVAAPFDPELQEAMEYLEDPEVPPNHVVRIHQHGYLLSGRLLRAARVSVSAEGPPVSAGDGDNEPGAEE